MNGGFFLPDTSEVLIGLPEGDHVRLSGWRHGTDGWVGAQADVRSGPWQGGINVEFYLDELPRFGEEVKRLYRELKGTATLDPIEPNLRLQLKGDGRGGIEVKGAAQSRFELETKLLFHFMIDQTFLPSIADCLCAHTGVNLLKLP